MSVPDSLPSPPPPRNWWQRNWKWVVPASCLSIMVLFALSFFTLFRHTDVCREAIARAEANPQVRIDLGEPIREGWWIGGRIRTTGPSGNPAFSVPLKGSRKDGTLYAAAHKSAGRWIYDSLEVRVEGRPERISLLLGEAPF